MFIFIGTDTSLTLTVSPVFTSFVTIELVQWLMIAAR
jgi:hypothetical protein